MSSESGGRSVLAPPECNAQGLSKLSKIRYTRSFLVSLANSRTETGLLEPSVLSELDSRLERPWVTSHDSDSKSCQENLDKGLLRVLSKSREPKTILVPLRQTIGDDDEILHPHPSPWYSGGNSKN